MLSESDKVVCGQMNFYYVSCFKRRSFLSNISSLKNKINKLILKSPFLRQLVLCHDHCSEPSQAIKSEEIRNRFTRHAVMSCRSCKHSAAVLRHSCSANIEKAEQDNSFVVAQRECRAHTEAFIMQKLIECYSRVKSAQSFYAFAFRPQQPSAQHLNIQASTTSVWKRH